MSRPMTPDPGREVVAEPGSAATGNGHRFTVDGSAFLEKHLHEVCGLVLDGVRDVIPSSRLEGLLLAGGYGRGEGGVLRTAGGDRPYNDVEFYVFVRGNAFLAERRYRDDLHALGEELSEPAGVEVEFKVLTLPKLRAARTGMFTYDLVQGHHWLWGDDRLLRGCDHHRQAELIPLHEATRLLFNRCSGLLFALERLRRADFGPKHADFVRRNLAKAELAFGDVLLTAHGGYHWSCRERSRRLGELRLAGELGWAEALLPLHQTGVEFKLHPFQSSEAREDLEAEHEQIRALGGRLWLWLESQRLGRRFDSAGDYAFDAVNKCPERAAWHNLLVNLRTFGRSAIRGARRFRYPRERLLEACALLLWGGPAGPDSELRFHLEGLLEMHARDFERQVAAYHRLWSRFN